MDDPNAAENTLLASTIGEFTWPIEIEVGTYDWQQTKKFPFPHLQLTVAPNPDDLSTEECRLLFHLCTISQNLERTKSARFTTWAHKMPDFVTLATTHDYTMQSLVALSATHLASTCKSAAMDQIAFAHRGNAFRSLSLAVGTLTQENSDAVLAASALLSWQSPGWQAWAALMQGIKTLHTTLQGWKAQSCFPEFLGDNFYELGIIPTYRSEVPGHAGLGLLEGSILSLERAMAFAADSGEQVKSLRQLLDFVQNLRIAPPGPNPQDQFKVLHPLRAWIIWLPVSFFNVTDQSIPTMTTLAHFYAVTLAVQLHLPSPGPAYYPKMRMEAIESLAGEINDLKQTFNPEGISSAVELMRFPREIATYFRDRLQMAEQAHGTTNVPTGGTMSMADSLALAATIDFEESI
ncbi:MAG: hypothetical protein ASARMPRED_003807 [Alectoria sarmentosa]|nr:MAG: hypothetical protein ASARMPRED_003807 [Alectoria sarmentosa]